MHVCGCCVFEDAAMINRIVIGGRPRRAAPTVAEVVAVDASAVIVLLACPTMGILRRHQLNQMAMINAANQPKGSGSPVWGSQIFKL